MKGKALLPPREVTTARQEANKASAKKSTGPRSPRGKARVALNALTHGIFAKAALYEHEDAHEFENLHQLLISSLAPADEFEVLLVQKIAVALWRTRRLLIYEKAKIDLANSLANAKGEPQISIPGRMERRTLLAMEDLERLLKYEALLEKEWMRYYLLLEQRRLIRTDDATALPSPLPLER